MFQSVAPTAIVALTIVAVGTASVNMPGTQAVLHIVALLNVHTVTAAALVEITDLTYAA